MGKSGQTGKPKLIKGHGKQREALDLARSVPPPPSRAGKPSSLLDTRVVYCGLRRAQSSRDNLEQLKKPPDRCVDSIYIDPAPVSAVEPPFNSNRTIEERGEVFWGETKAPPERSFEDRHASTHQVARQRWCDWRRRSRRLAIC